MKIGIVGVGKWGRVLAQSFEIAGAEVCAHDRRSSEEANGFGERVPWSSMVATDVVDAVVCAASPRLVTEIYQACREVKKPCFLTKPFFPADLRDAPTAAAYVDYVHIASSLWGRFKKGLRGDRIEKLEIEFSGDGPVRGYPGTYDYGSHALALAHDALGLTRVTRVDARPSAMESSRPGTELLVAEMQISGTPVWLSVGNGAQQNQGRRRVHAVLAGGSSITYEERDRIATLSGDGPVPVSIKNHDPLSTLVERFMWDVETKRVSPYFFELSWVVGKELEEIRRSAGLQRPPELLP